MRALLEGAQGTQSEMPVDSLREIFREVLAACLALETPAKVAYLGPEGGTGHAVARAHFGASATYIAAETTPLVLEEVARHRASYALLPYETQSEGPVHATIAALTATDLRIVAVVEASPNLHLMNRSGNAGDIAKIYGTPSDRALCERSVSSSAPSARVIDVKSPLLACQLAADDAAAAALSSEAVGAQLDLQVARRDVLNRPNRARYAVVGTRPSTRSGEDSTGVVFSVRDSPGALLDVLKGFAERSINLTKIQSRPVETEGSSYLFFVEVVGHSNDRALVTAFEEVKRLTKFFKVRDRTRPDDRARGSMRAGTMVRSTTLTALLACVALAGCPASTTNTPPAHPAQDLATQIDADPIALLPPMAAAVFSIDNRAFLSSGAGTTVGPLTDMLLPLGPETGFVASRDVDRITAGASCAKGRRRLGRLGSLRRRAHRPGGAGPRRDEGRRLPHADAVRWAGHLRRLRGGVHDPDAAYGARGDADGLATRHRSNPGARAAARGPQMDDGRARDPRRLRRARRRPDQPACQSARGLRPLHVGALAQWAADRPGARGFSVIPGQRRRDARVRRPTPGASGGLVAADRGSRRGLRIGALEHGAPAS